MAFLYDVKKELASVKEKGDLCKKAFVYGAFLFSEQFNLNNIIINIYSSYAANKLCEICCNCVDIICEKKIKLSNSKAKRNVINFSIPIKSDREKIIKFLQLDVNYNNVLNKDFLLNENLIKSFLRGAFLVYGKVFEPSKEYHLEFSIKSERLANELSKFILTHGINIKFNVAKMKNNYTVYIKGSENVFDFLVFIGAKNSAMELMQVKMLKEVRNYVNRTTNFQAANIEKTAVAAAEQIAAINTIKAKNINNYLTDELIEIARLRLKNPEMSLSELGKSLKKPLSRSGVNHRLKKIIKIANDIKNMGDK